LSLVRGAKAENDVCVVSIFVNPLQFGPGEDFEKYPRPFDRDKDLLEKNGADFIFTVSASEMYPSGFSTYVSQDRLPEILEGRSRPGHFRGVLTVCAKLFNIVKPDRAYFGEKDFQQTVIIARMVRDLGFGIDIKILPTIRDKDGLAFSSRNVFLSPEERERALCLKRSLQEARKIFAEGETNRDVIIKAMQQVIKATSGVEIDYTEVVDAETLEPAQPVGRESVALVAAKLGSTRLIDNMRLG
jgi:pantoate--beta-alanine ligase